MKRGSVIGNIAKDLGLDVNRLSSRKARIDTEDSRKRYCDINLNTGELIVAERIDREGLCGKKSSCVLKQELMLENPLELHRISLHIDDINDNSPHFDEDVIKMEIRESADKGERFLLEEAHDPDIGNNAVQSYTLESNENFILYVKSNDLAGKYCELVLNKELDREQQQEVKLILTAVDGGTPPRSGTVAIHVTVLDANDNAPVFSQAIYKVSLPENSPADTVVVTVSATDADEGQNGKVTYAFGHVSEEDKTLFLLNRNTGEITVVGRIDYEEKTAYELRVLAKDSAGNSFMTEMVPKIAQARSLVSKVIAVDADSGQNAWLSYHIIKASDPGLFTIGVHSGEIRTQRDISESDSMKQNLIVSVRDNGQPSLSATCALCLLISDNLAEVPELKDMSRDESSSKLTFYLIIALVSVSTFFLTFIIIILAVRFRRRKPRLLFDGAVAIPSAYLPPNYAEVEGAGTLRSTYNYDAYLTTGSRTSDFKFVRSYNEGTLTADLTLKKTRSVENILDDLGNEVKTSQLVLMTMKYN
ncbi:protocadherin beta-3-like protein [Labeo rohita]|uniref:Protocadherin beta-3-like protein n=1 Tax=Labeo rohita TaxID=84645 RepID=A0A498MUY6_LABRO|nr:protocadherin beta-3-like protein [Labeo rohita]